MTMRYMIKIMMNSMENDQGLKQCDFSHTKLLWNTTTASLILFRLYYVLKYGTDLGRLDVMMSFTERCR